MYRNVHLCQICPRESVRQCKIILKVQFSTIFLLKDRAQTPSTYAHELRFSPKIRKWLGYNAHHV